MDASILRNIFCWTMIAIFPVSLMAADSAAAMLYAKGTAWLNGSTVPRSSAIFPGDLVQTKADSAANINASGSSVLVLSDSLVQFEGNAVQLEHGGVTVSTSRGMATRAGDVTVSPAAPVWTQFEVKDVDGNVQIVAQKGDVTISDQTGTTTLAQGQQTTREQSESQSSKKKRQAGGAAPAAAGGILDSKVAIGIGLAVVGGVTTWVLIQGDEPLSPSK